MPKFMQTEITHTQKNGLNPTEANLSIHPNEHKEIRAEKPLLTIITATFNAAELLPHTIKSIREQTYEDIEWIIVDGNSTDRTIDVIRGNEDVIDCWIHEPDNGIYDAWNKGIKLAHGEFISFLGADDCWASKHTVATLMSEVQKSDADVVCAKAMVMGSDGNKMRMLGEPWDQNKMWFRQVVAHPGMIHRAELFKAYGNFDSTFKITGDYEWLLRVNTAVKTKFVDYVSVHMRDGGVSATNIPAVLSEVRIAQQHHAPHSSFTRECYLFLYVIRIYMGKLKRLITFSK